MTDDDSQSPYLTHDFIERMDARLNRLEVMQGKIKQAIFLTGKLSFKAALAAQQLDRDKLDEMHQDILRLTLEIQTALRNND